MIEAILDSADCAVQGMLAALRRLDRVLERAAASPDAAGFAEDGLYAHAGSHLALLAELFDLSPFDVGVVIAALAPDIDLRYERIYARLQDDITRRRPTVDFVLRLLCTSAEERLLRRDRLAPDAPVVRHGIVRLGTDAPDDRLPLLARQISVDERIVRFLLGDRTLDADLRACCRLTSAPATGDDEPVAAVDSDTPILVFQGGGRLRRRQAAEAAAAARSLALLVADRAACGETGGPSDLRRWIDRVLREARLQRAVPYLEGFDDGLAALQSSGAVAAGEVLVGVARSCAVDGVAEGGIPVAVVELPPLDSARRRDCWQRALSRRAIPLDEYSLDHLARRYRMEPEHIDRAVDRVSAARRAGRLVGVTTGSEPHGDAVMEQLCDAARAQTRGALDRLAHRIPLRHTWDDLVLPARTIEELRELCERIERSDQVFDAWGFGRTLSGTGTAALFAGPSGAGKTLAAAVVAGSVGLDLFKIDLAGVVSKYIGETEQNLERIFAAAEGANAILFFDEADAIFGKRTEVRDSHDRYANLEVSYLLQKLESYGGPTILATNLSQHMDESLLRRFAFSVRFPLPDEIGRRQIWRRMWPDGAPLDPAIDLDALADRFRLGGGHIRNAALAAAFLAAADGGVVRTPHLLLAIEREYQKMGKTVALAHPVSSGEAS